MILIHLTFKGIWARAAALSRAGWQLSERGPDPVIRAALVHSICSHNAFNHCN